MKVIKEIGRNPNVDWILILVICLLLIGSLGFIDFSLYNAVTSGSIQGAGTTAGTSFTKLNEKAVSSVIERFAEKEAVSTEARKSYSGFTDPSI